jgi:hypothetical protein
MNQLFGPVGRSDPQAVLKDATILGTRYAFVSGALHDRRLAWSNSCQIKGAAIERSSERRTLPVPEVCALAAAVAERFRLR